MEISGYRVPTTTRQPTQKDEKIKKENQNAPSSGTVVIRMAQGEKTTVEVVGTPNEGNRLIFAKTIEQYGADIKNKNGLTDQINPAWDVAGIAGMTDPAWSEVDAIMESFYKGEATAEDVSSKFDELAELHIFKSAADGKTDKKLALDEFYNEFRRRAIAAGVNSCHEKGQALDDEITSLTPDANNDRATWKYYDADDYYKCEELLESITKAADPVSQKHTGESFEVPDYSDRVNSYYYEDFNTAWANPFGGFNQYMIDSTIPPPEGFSLLLRNNPNGSTLTVDYNENGESVSKQVELPFTKGHEVTATLTSVSVYQDGKLIEGPGDMRKKPDHIEYYNASKLLKFYDDSETAETVNEYLKNFNVYSFKGWHQNNRLQKAQGTLNITV